MPVLGIYIGWLRRCFPISAPSGTRSDGGRSISVCTTGWWVQAIARISDSYGSERLDNELRLQFTTSSARHGLRLCCAKWPDDYGVADLDGWRHFEHCA
ncbi:hypothetical protein MRX96_022343 [Rhipicephalus microplus]